MTRHALVLGPTGVAGGAIARLLDADPEWQLTTASRRRIELPRSTHLELDLLDPERTNSVFAAAATVTHVVYAAYVERPTMAESVAPNVAMLAHALDALELAGAKLERVVLIGGGKSYGEHLGPYKTPARESDPRHLGPIFYNDQEDLLTERAAERGFTWTVLRPDIVIGPSLGSSMNLLTTLAVYGALCREAGVPLRFPGTHAAWTALHQVTDADLLAEATAWALTAETAANEIFNVTNGDLFRWQHLWPHLADALDVPTAPPQPMSLAEQLADTDSRYDQLTSWPFVDAIWSMGFDLVQSTTKIRQAGFTGFRDTEASLPAQLRQLRASGAIP